VNVARGDWACLSGRDAGVNKGGRTMWLITPLLAVSIFMRRRPLARAAVVGGAAYYAGKRRSESEAREYDQEARLQDIESQGYGAPPPQQSGGITDDSMDKLTKLAELRQQGVLTDAEFEVQKQKILQGL
jgi:Short C-terminal domain